MIWWDSQRGIFQKLSPHTANMTSVPILDTLKQNEFLAGERR